MVPYLIDNPSIGFVQARWTFTNPEESYLTKAGPIRQSASACRIAWAFCFSVLQTSPCSADNGIRAAPVLLMSRAYTPVLENSVVEPQSAAAGAADLPELPLQVRAVGALCFRRLLQLQWHCWCKLQWQPLPCLHLLCASLGTTFCPGSASCPRYCPSVAVRLCPHQEQLVISCSGKHAADVWKPAVMHRKGRAQLHLSA